jgi:hypothetical protein
VRMPLKWAINENADGCRADIPTTTYLLVELYVLYCAEPLSASNEGVTRVVTVAVAPSVKRLATGWTT